MLPGDCNASSRARRQLLTDARLTVERSPLPLQSRSGLNPIRFQGALTRTLAAEASFISKRGRYWQFFVTDKLRRFDRVICRSRSAMKPMDRCFRVIWAFPLPITLRGKFKITGFHWMSGMAAELVWELR